MEVERGPLSTHCKRRQPSPTMQAELLRRQKNQCAYCGSVFGSVIQRGTRQEVVELNWDHVVPFAYSGKNDIFVAACGRCNRKKGSKMFCTVHPVRSDKRRKPYKDTGPKPLRGQIEHERHLQGFVLTMKEQIAAKCFNCMGGYRNMKGTIMRDEKDCHVKTCPLYRNMPYRRGKTIVGPANPSWEVITEIPCRHTPPIHRRRYGPPRAITGHLSRFETLFEIWTPSHTNNLARGQRRQTRRFVQTSKSPGLSFPVYER